MNQAASLPRINPWIVVALAAALILATVTAVMLVAEPGLMHALRTTLHSSQQMACGGIGLPC